MSTTDIEYMKQQEAGQLNTSGSASNSASIRSTVNGVFSRCHPFAKTGAENAATNVAETPMYVVPRTSVLNSVKYITGTNVANDSTDYVVITISKRDAATGLTQTTLATWNTHTSAQNAITQNIPASFSLVTNSDATIAAGSSLAYTIGKYGSGKAVAAGSIVFDLQEI